MILGSPGGNCSKDVLFLYGKGNIVWLIKTFYQEKDNVILDDISFKSCLCTCFNISTDIEEKFEDTKRDKKGIRMYNKVKVVILKSNWLQPSSRHLCHMYFSSFCYSSMQNKTKFNLYSPLAAITDWNHFHKPHSVNNRLINTSSVAISVIQYQKYH